MKYPCLIAGSNVFRETARTENDIFYTLVMGDKSIRNKLPDFIQVIREFDGSEIRADPELVTLYNLVLKTVRILPDASIFPEYHVVEVKVPIEYEDSFHYALTDFISFEYYVEKNYGGK